MKIKSRNNKLYLHFSHNGQMVRKSMKMEDTAKNRTILQKQIIPEIQRQLVMGEFFEKENVPTLDKFAEISFSMHKQNRRESTQKQYQEIYNLHIKSVFGTTRIDKIKRSELFLWQNDLLAKLTGKTVRSIRTVLMTILEDAYKEEIIEKNYLKLVNAPKTEETREKKPFSVEEIYQIIDNAPQNIKAYFAVGFFTGMRTGEIIALKWENIDFENWIIKVRHSIRDGRFTPPKTKSSIRDIEILEALKKYLLAHRKISDENSVFVFETQKGQPFSRSDKISSHYWKKVLEQQNIPYRNLYQMRHTFASQMLMNNEDILWTSQMLGHKDSSMTLEKYARYIPQKNIKRAVFLER
ncbi:MAG: site-specific integrase [Sulfurimonas sp.]|uniref:tyrosine-type recombinase/integrase n=1 Tax=Sulfurimonas sp. TaxID=2022749 RepID=UPI0026264AFD|nr:site-specific integrase [Sulfurimonas sp.]MDD5373533.1 site-specific integrase [Sulfurimonas sp.]